MIKRKRCWRAQSCCIVDETRGKLVDCCFADDEQEAVSCCVADEQEAKVEVKSEEG
jgi:hypothetical protein